MASKLPLGAERQTEDEGDDKAETNVRLSTR
jgi:hypothetical protein